MKHSDLRQQFYELRIQEKGEFVAALVAHGGYYQFYAGNESDSELPHIYVSGGDNLEGASEYEVLVHRAELEYGFVRVYGQEFYSGHLCLIRDYDLNFGSYHEMMDYMDEPEKIQGSQCDYGGV